MRFMFIDAEAFDANITVWATVEGLRSEAMFGRATAWLDKYERADDGADDYRGDGVVSDGPPSAWA